jgi:hypothetical protein
MSRLMSKSASARLLATSRSFTPFVPSGYPHCIARLGDTDLDVFPLCLGGNVFGWTIDEERSFAVLDAYVQAGGNFIDTADATAGGPGGRASPSGSSAAGSPRAGTASSS